jgi:teichuronic acid biosynthesis glycosyltransferase TuaC
MPVKVLFVTHTIDDKGTLATPGIADQIAELQRSGVQIDMVKTRVKNKGSYLLATLKVFLLNFQRKRYDLVHATYSLNGLAARCQFKSPVVLTLMGSDLMSKQPIHTRGGRDARLGRFISRLVDRVIVQTPEMAAALTCRKEIVQIIPYGINTQIFTPKLMDENRRELGLPLDEKCVLFPYNPARPEKRFDLVEQAVDLLKKDHRVNLQVVYSQPRETIARYMNACDAMVLASDYEGSPVAIREALACCLPIVSTRVGDVPAIISEINGCHLCDQDPQDIAAGLKKVFEVNRRLEPSESVLSLNTAWSANEVLKVYQSLLAEQS